MRRRSLRVLTYHRVLPADRGAPVDPSLVSSRPGILDRQMRALAARYRPVSAEQVVAAARGEELLPDRAVLVTFDDAYRDVGEVAWPILRRHGVPATVFVATAYPDRPDLEFWWDRLYRRMTDPRRPALHVPALGTLDLSDPSRRGAVIRRLQAHLKRLPHEEAMAEVERICAELGEGGPGDGAAGRPDMDRVLSWDELRALARDGVALAPHTRTHPALDRVPADRVREEARGSRSDLTREIGSVLPLFAYPFGQHDDAVVAILREEGFEVAVTATHGHNPLPFADPLRLRRTNVSRRTTPALFRLRLTPAFARIDRWRHRTEAG